MKKLVALVVTLIGLCTPTFAQVYGTYGMVPTVQNGVVTLPIPGAPGLSINVATGTAATALQNLNTDPTAVKLYMGDDSGQTVPLGFDFPYFNRIFTTSIMYSNGIVNFNGNYLPGAGCCSGQDLRYLRDTTYNYSIMPLWTDLIDTTGNTTYYKRTSTSMTYGWYGTKEYGTNNPNTFELRIDSSGGINTTFTGARVTNHPVTSGMTGDLSKGEYFQFFHNPNGGLNITTPTTWTTQGINFDQCASNPLSSTSCPTYQQAYHDQQCSINPLSFADCPGYTIAFHDQQCSINPLYMADCPGYAIAFHDQQCNANQLSYTDCPGYAAAYFSQQCTASALYSPSCPGYQTAYFTQQCSMNPLYNQNCPGYATAYHDRQCSLNPLYMSDCTGYQRAYHDQQCSISALYASDCPGYTAAYQTQQFNRACQANPQSSPRCSGYVTPAAAVVITTNTASTTNASTTSTTDTSTTSSTADTTSTTSAVVTPGVSTNQSTQNTTGTTNTSNQNQTTSGGVVTTQSTTAPAAAGTISAAGTLSNPTAVAVIGDSVVNNVISNNSQTQTAIVATSAVAQSNAPSPVNSPTSATSTTTSSTSSSSSSNSSSSSSSNSNSSPSAGGSATQNTRAALVATLTRPGGASGMNSGSTGSSSGSDSNSSAPTQGQVTAAAGAAMKDADSAGSMEQQAKVQNVVLGAMAYVPGFDVYNVALKDVPFYKPYAIYGNQRTVDNRNVARRLFGATDEVHNKMVQEQFQLGN